MRGARLLCLSLCLTPLSFFGTSSAATTACADLPHADHPRATLHQGKTTAVVFLPDVTNGYYRGSRFDWSGVVGCLNVDGHDLFGEWFPRYDPLLNDSITGPVEEFRDDVGAVGYNAAQPGQPFVKIGVGTLRRLDSGPYKFGAPYPLLDSGKWSTETHADSLRFTQEFHSVTGVAYRYTKVLRLADHGHTLLLEHTLTNLGSDPIDTGVYDHDFFMLDHQPTGPGLSIHLNFPVTSIPPPSGPPAGTLAPYAAIQGNSIVYQHPIEPHETAASYLGGYGPTPADNDITVTNTTTGLSVRQTGDHPISKFYLWSIPTTIAPEAYIHLSIPPNATEHWSIRYQITTSKPAPRP